MNEAETRAEHIDPALKAAGWGVVEGSRVRREYPIAPGRIEGHGKRGKALTADYVLEYRNRKLAVIEAKAWDVALTEGVAQAKNYGGKLAVRFAYATNGHGIYEIDMSPGQQGQFGQQCPPEREVPLYPTPDELWARTFAEDNAWRDRFSAVPYEDKGGSHPTRYYQDIAIERVIEAIASGRNRILLTLATGTGKTFIAFQIAWKLFHSRWNLSGQPTRRPRILFLADRNILANQAYNAFSAFPEDALVRIAPDEIRKKGKTPKNGSLFFTIFQTFMTSGVNQVNPVNTVNKVPTTIYPARQDAPPPLAMAAEPPAIYSAYPPDFFDFIVIDECHRGGANDESNWRGILDYFAPAVQMGMTATPKRDENVDTYRYFGDPVYIYSLKDGINDGFLTPFKVRQIQTTLDEYVYTPDDTVIEGEIEQGKRYEEEDFNRIIEIRKREEYRVRLFMDLINQTEKTLVFCASQNHALAVRDLINQMKTSKDPNYCQRVFGLSPGYGNHHQEADQHGKQYMTNNTPYAERYRPQFHFSARENWLNDPNGCVFVNGEYHLFFQHNPTGLKWGNMTWGHAVSTDLVHWRQLPNAISPYDDGTIFSGSAIMDVDNSSGFGMEGAAPLVAAFTHARKPFGQAIAFSTDQGRTWSLHEDGRHVVPNQGLDEGERDPKVFWHSPSRRWVMVLWVRMGLARFFTSRDLKQWTHASDFSGDGFYECPDLFELPVDGNPQNVKWVLMDAAFNYWLGSFDGTRFVPEAGPMRGDFGGNFYAAQTWNNTGRRVVQIGWMRDGEYPNMPFSQQMSFPCELSLRTTLKGVRLCRMPVDEIKAINVDSDLITDRVLAAGEAFQSDRCGDLFDITAEIDAPPHAAFGIRLHEIDIACADGYIRCLGKEVPLTAHDQKVSLRILVDRTSIEIYAQGGELCMSSCFLSLEQDTTIRCYSEAGTIAVRKFVVHRLRSAW